MLPGSAAASGCATFGKFAGLRDRKKRLLGKGHGKSP